MAQNMINLRFDEEQLAAIVAAMEVLETNLAGLIALPSGKRRRFKRMGPNSETFCRRSLEMLELNPQLVPSGLGLADAQGDLATLDQLRPILVRLRRVTERAIDSEIALGGDVMATALKGYALLKVAGRSEGLESIRKQLGSGFSRSARHDDTSDDEPAPTEE